MKLPSILNIFRSKASAITPILFERFKQHAVWAPDRFQQYADEGYALNTAVYACVNEIARAAGGIGWILRKKGATTSSKDSLIDDHPLLNLLRRPNPFQGGASFTEAVTAYLQISGNTIIERVGPENGPPTELWSHRPDRFKIIPHKIEKIIGYKFTLDGNSKDFVNGEILHRKLFNPTDEWYGLSPIAVAAIDIDADNEAKKWNLNLTKNDMKPPGAFTTDAVLQDHQFRRLKEQLTKEYSGSGNVGKRLVLDGGLKWINYALNQKDADWVRGMKMSERRIYNAYQVPGELIGDSDNKTYSNYKEARKSFYQETMLPYMDGYRDDLNNWLTPLFGDNIVLDYNRDGIEAIQQDKTELFTRLAQSNWMTINEKRVESSLDEVDGGDVILVPSKMVALQDVGKDLEGSSSEDENEDENENENEGTDD